MVFITRMDIKFYLLLLMNQKAIIVLTRGYIENKKYDQLINRNKSIEKNLVDKSIDIVIFHEGNIFLEHQKYIKDQTSELQIKFVDVSEKAFQKEEESINFYEPSKHFGLGYRHMCSFWFIDFWNYVENYSYIIRIDEDCTIDFNLDQKFDRMEKENKVFIYGMTFRDIEIVTHGLNQFTVDFFRENEMGVPKRSPVGPYTNVICLNLNKLRQDNLLKKYIEKLDKSNNIYIYRWGDLVLWGEVLSYMYKQNDHCLDQSIKYYHGSHKAQIN